MPWSVGICSSDVMAFEGQLIGSGKFFGLSLVIRFGTGNSKDK